jgi:tetratricopeptide (TPR) repeat protein
MLYTLGSLSLTLGGREFKLTPYQGAFLAYLAIRKGRVKRTELTRLFWPTKKEARARHSLSQLLHQISHVAPDASLCSDLAAVWTDRLDIDVLTMTRCVGKEDFDSALALYGGPFLDVGLLPPPVMEWRDEIAAKVSSLVAQCAEHLLCRRTGQEFQRILESCDLLVGSTVLEMSVASRIISALIRCGEVDRARQCHLAMIRNTCDEDIPTFEMYEDNEERLRCGTPGSQDRAFHAPFVGREAETRELSLLWREVSNGRGHTVVIVGEPGIGKTRLATQAMRRIAITGGRVWVVHCNASTQRLPYSVVADLVRENIADAPDTHANGGELPLLLTSDSALGSGQPQGGNSDEWTYRLVQRLTKLLIDRCGDRALAILIDDAQWLDDFTALLVRYWSYRLRASPVLLILTARTADPEGLPEWMNSDLTGARYLRLGRLGVAEAAMLLSEVERTRGVVLHPTKRDAVLWQSAGQPYLLLEAVEALIDDGSTSDAPASVVLPAPAEDMLRRRFAGLSSDANWIAGLLAVFGRAIEPAELAVLSGLQEQAAAVSLEALIGRGIIAWERGAIAYAHDLMRETAYRQLLPTTRALLHGRIAAFLASSGSSGLLAQHYAGAGDREKAGTCALRAAKESLRRHLYSDCEYYLRLAIDHGTQPIVDEATRHLARYYLQLGRTADAERLIPLIGARSVGHDTVLLQTVASVDSGLAAGSICLTDLLARARAITEMATLLQASDMAPIAGTLFDLALDSSEASFGIEVADAFAAAAAGTESLDFKLQTGAISSVWYAMTQGVSAGRERLKTVEGLFKATEAAGSKAIFLSAEGTLALLSGSLYLAADCYQKAAVLAETAGDIRRQMVIRLNEGVVLLEQGEFQKALENFERVVTAPNIHHQIRAYANLAILHYEQQNWTLASQAADAVHTANSKYKSQLFRDLSAAIHGLVALKTNDDASVHHFGQRLDSAEPRCQPDEDVYIVAFMARFSVRNGRYAAAMTTIDQALAWTSSRNRPAHLRLLCEKAEVLRDIFPDGAYALAKQAATEAAECGAILSLRRAQEILHDCHVQ